MAAIAVAPVLLLMTFTIIQGSVYWHATNAAHSIASIGYEAQRLYGASSGAAQHATSEYQAQLAATLDNINVSVANNGTAISVTVTGNAPSIVPGWQLGISETVTGTVERWKP